MNEIEQEVPLCEECGKRPATDDYEELCEECEREREIAQAEAAYERYLERSYGDDKPVTLDEQHQAAWEEKRRLK